MNGTNINGKAMRVNFGTKSNMDKNTLANANHHPQTNQPTIRPPNAPNYIHFNPNMAPHLASFAHRFQSEHAPGHFNANVYHNDNDPNVEPYDPNSIRPDPIRNVPEASAPPAVPLTNSLSTLNSTLASLVSRANFNALGRAMGGAGGLPGMAGGMGAGMPQPNPSSGMGMPGTMPGLNLSTLGQLGLRLGVPPASELPGIPGGYGFAGDDGKEGVTPYDPSVGSIPGINYDKTNYEDTLDPVGATQDLDGALPEGTNPNFSEGYEDF
uniref:Uncharacterized protein n=1 Tax=Arcella intermedia TaxID=1963864 RepID=A0A6B2L9X5_9EUKA